MGFAQWVSNRAFLVHRGCWARGKKGSLGKGFSCWLVVFWESGVHISMKYKHDRPKNFLAISLHTRNKHCKALTTTAWCAQQDNKHYEHFALTVFEDVNGLNCLDHHNIAGRGTTACQIMSSIDQKSNSCTATSWFGRTHSDVFVTCHSVSFGFCSSHVL